MQSVGLIIPPSAFLLDERVFVSLGILKVASSLQAHGYKVNLLDFSGIENYQDVLRVYLRTCTDVAIGITTTTPQFPAVYQLVQIIKSLRPDLKIILGGPHVTLTLAARKLEKKRGREGRAHAVAAQLEELATTLVAGDGEIAVLGALSVDPPKVL